MISRFIFWVCYEIFQILLDKRIGLFIPIRVQCHPGVRPCWRTMVIIPICNDVMNVASAVAAVRSVWYMIYDYILLPLCYTPILRMTRLQKSPVFVHYIETWWFILGFYYNGNLINMLCSVMLCIASPCWLLWYITRAPSQYKDRLIYVWRFPC